MVGDPRRARARSRVVIAPALYAGRLRHRRFHPRDHAFSYSIFMALLDIDRIAETMAVSRWTSHNRFNVLSFDERDHLGAGLRPLRDALAASALSVGTELPDGRIFLLTHLRYAGYVFNPISLYYCHSSSGQLQLIMADVRNTYGGRHQYWLRPSDLTPHRLRALVPKQLFVSPFMQGPMDYEFVVTPPGERLTVHMNVIDRRAPRQRCFDATLAMTASPWTAAAVRRVVWQFPFMTAKVIVAIHWQALRLRWKRVPETSPEVAS